MSETTRSSGESPDWPAGESPSGSSGGQPTASAPSSGTAPGDAGLGDPTPSDADQAGSGREWVGQLQSMIDNLATQAAPVMRQIGAKAAELAATAAEKAGPIAHRAAEATEAAGARLAERGRGVAADLRRDDAGTEGAAAGDQPNSIEPGASPDRPGSRSGSATDTAGTVGE